jgi:phage baseplate assembly protein W
MAYKNIEISSAANVAQQAVKKNQFYKGFSTLTNSSNTKLYDFELVCQDILNHFNTRKGERVMNPSFGSNIWNFLMEPLTEEVKDMLVEDINRICTFDPRVTPIQMDLTEYESGYILELTLLLNGTDQSKNMKLAFDQNIGLIVE